MKKVLFFVLKILAEVKCRSVRQQIWSKKINGVKRGGEVSRTSQPRCCGCNEREGHRHIQQKPKVITQEMANHA